MVLHLSGIQWVIVVGFSVVWAVLGYVLSENDRKRLGRTPWGLPSAVWAILWFLSLVLGLVLYLIAHSVGIRRAQQPPPLSGPPVAGSTRVVAPTGKPSVAELFPSYPQPANSQPPAIGPSPTLPKDPALPQFQQGPSPWPYSPPAWHADPSGRFHFRWWDGRQWTSQVSTDGHHLIDTNPDQRIGPY